MEKVFKQAQQDPLATRLITDTSEAYFYKGIKILKTELNIKVFNTKFGGDYYTEVTSDDYKIFERQGWRVGCYMVATKNNKRSLNSLANKIANELKGKLNLKNYTTLVTQRKIVINRYLETIKLLQDEIR